TLACSLYLSTILSYLSLVSSLRFPSSLLCGFWRSWNLTGGRRWRRCGYERPRRLSASAGTSTTERRLAMIWKALIWAILIGFGGLGSESRCLHDCIEGLARHGRHHRRRIHRRCGDGRVSSASHRTYDRLGAKLTSHPL